MEIKLLLPHGRRSTGRPDRCQISSYFSSIVSGVDSTAPPYFSTNFLQASPLRSRGLCIARSQFWTREFDGLKVNDKMFMYVMCMDWLLKYKEQSARSAALREADISICTTKVIVQCEKKDLWLSPYGHDYD